MSALIIRHGNPAALPIDLLLSSIPSLSRAALDRLVDRAIDQMDVLDPDPDLEPNGDEMDTGNAEDELFVGTPWGLGGPGCPLSDAAEDDDPDKCLAGDDGYGSIIAAGRTIWGAPDPADQ